MEGFTPRALSSAMLARTAQLRTLTWLGCQMHCSIAPAAMTLNTIVARLRSARWAAPTQPCLKSIVTSSTSARRSHGQALKLGSQSLFPQSMKFMSETTDLGGGRGEENRMFQNDPPEMCQEELTTTS